MKTLDRSWIGSVSQGTTLAEHLIPRFEWVLQQAGESFDRPESVDRLMDGEELTATQWEEVSWYMHEDLFGALNDIAPEGCYFGAHEGDGCDYGFWPCERNEFDSDHPHCGDCHTDFTPDEPWCEDCDTCTDCCRCPAPPLD